MNILDQLVESTTIRVQRQKGEIPLEELRERAHPLESRFPFELALGKAGISFICEVKKASPSKGIIAPDFPYRDIAREYEAAGADAVSVLTEPERFLGEDRFLQEIAAEITIPTLRKDFIIDQYQIVQARELGASAVLLICAILDARRLTAFRELADSLGMSCLVEAHDEKEVEMARKAGARIIGVNNRDLRTFQVDLETSLRLRELAPPETLFVSESGIATREDVRRLEENGVDAVLIGETLMRSSDKRAALEALRR